jgi:hypothetical protein
LTSFIADGSVSTILAAVGNFVAKALRSKVALAVAVQALFCREHSVDAGGELTSVGVTCSLLPCFVRVNRVNTEGELRRLMVAITRMSKQARPILKSVVRETRGSVFMLYLYIYFTAVYKKIELLVHLNLHLSDRSRLLRTTVNTF